MIANHEFHVLIFVGNMQPQMLRLNILLQKPLKNIVEGCELMHEGYLEHF